MPSGSAPAPAAAATGGPNDVLTIRHTNGQTGTMTRREWEASPYNDPRSGWTVANDPAVAAPQVPQPGQPGSPEQGPPVLPPAAPAPPVTDPRTAGLGPYYLQAIKDHQARLGRSMTYNDFLALADPANNWGLGSVVAMRAPTPDDMKIPGFAASSPRAVIEYSNGLKLGIDATVDQLQDGGAGVTAGQILDQEFKPDSKKSPTQVQAEIDLAKAQAGLANANKRRQDLLNAGGANSAVIREAEANIESAKASAESARTNVATARRLLEAGMPEAQVQSIIYGAAANVSNAQSNAQNAATGQGRLILYAALGETDRQYKEGLIDNETRRLLVEEVWRRWQADNTNTQTVVAAAGKTLEADLTERNQNIALDNTRLNAANSGFSDDLKTVGGLNEWMEQGSDTGFWMLKGLQGMRKAQIQDWGGLQEHAPVRRSGALEQLAFNTPIALRSLESREQIEQMKDDIRNGRRDAGFETRPIAAPQVAPAPLPAIAVPSRPSTSVPQPRPAQPVPQPVQQPAPSKPPEYHQVVPPPMEDPPSQSLVQSNMLLGSSLRPIQFAQGGTPIAARDLFGRTRPVVDRRYSWLA